MAKIKSRQRVYQYSPDFKIKAVKLSYIDGVGAQTIAEVLNLHPFMLYRWRKEYREGKIRPNNDSYVAVTMEKPKQKRKKPSTEVERLRSENARLKKEVDTLKKWQRYLKEARRNDSGL